MQQNFDETASALQIEPSQLDRLFASYILAGKDFVICRHSNTVSEHFGSLAGLLLFDFFTISAGTSVIADTETLLLHCGNVITLAGTGIFMKCRFECMQPAGYLFVIEHDFTNNNFTENIEQVADNIWEHNFTTGITRFSKKQSELLNAGIEDDNVTLWWNSIHPSDRPVLEAIDARYKEGTIDHHCLEYRLLCKDGSIKWVLDKGVVVKKNAAGKPLITAGTHTDITSIKQAESALRQSEQRFNSLSENLNDGILVEDEYRNVILSNQQFCTMFNISFTPQALSALGAAEVINHCGKSAKSAALFTDLVKNLVQQRSKVTGLIIELFNGNIYEIAHTPVFIDNEFKGILWKFSDVTDRINADKKLEAQKKFYEDVLNEIPADVAVLNEKREYLYVNPYAVKDDELRRWLVGKKDEDFCLQRNKPLDIALRRKQLFEQVIESGKQLEWEEKNITRDGKALHYLRKLYPVIDDNGRVKFMIGYGIDITDRKQFEDDLSLSEKRYRDLFNFSQALICTHDMHGTILTINPATCRLLGYSEAEMIGHKLYSFIPREDLVLFKEKYLDAFSHGGSHKGVFCAVSKSGKKNYLLYQNYKVEEPGKEPYVIGFSQDITERKKIEEAIRNGEEKYRSIIENMNLGMVELDADSTILFANENLCRMSGYDMPELIGKKLYNVFSEGESRLFIKQKMYLKKEGVSEVYEFVTRNKAGEPRWWLVSGSPLHLHTGEFKGSLLICLDITNQKILEQELRKAKQLAEQSSKAKDLFLANMSHEIRTPMNAILGMAKQLERTVMDGQQQFYLNAINNAASNLLVIINDILDFSKIEAGKMTLESTAFELEAVVGKALQVIVHKAEEKGLALYSKIDTTIAPVLIGDPYRINQILINLLGNSVKFTEKGSISIYCSVSAERESSQLINIEVVDSGIGMSDDFQHSLFNKFEQEDDNNGKRYSGTGLGMSIVKELIELMHGNITVQSKKNIGTIVSVNIPFNKGIKEDLAQTEAKKISSNTLRNKRILLVEDNEMNRVLATIILKQYSAIIDEAINGEEAIAALKTNEYDLVLMDMRMPVMDGIEATQVIRQEISKTIPIIALTANAITGEKQKCLESGMNDFLVKPFEEEELVQMLAKWLGINSLYEQTNNQAGSASLVSEPLFSIENLKNISRGNKEFIEKMLTIFVKEVKLALQEIRLAEESSNIDKIRSTAHRIKPSLTNMAVNAIRQEILDLEVFELAGEKLSQLPEMINKVENVLTDVIEQINEVIISKNY
ncbi:PAS domain S-box protein [Panacibacter sp. DH6]|uniref:Sensory/regulatory protein RpfC n=1 Tax=Panacibacter microcysteis TaxID=2793269 RepID=A0A931E450_9BACT|nr:PAS domain S-box protein [Panacibacter microcysteis]MBG9376713.1 PAS domain S-box protein [Panacibacter microcysteis]